MKTVEVTRPEPPKPYQPDLHGYRQALQWVRSAGMEDYARDELDGQEPEVIVRKVNLMRGCWG